MRRKKQVATVVAVAEAEEKTDWLFEELSDDAKETAIEWYRNSDPYSYDWWDYTYDYWAEKLEKEYGIDVYKSVSRPVWKDGKRTNETKTVQEVQITFDLYPRWVKFDIQSIDSSLFLKAIGYGHLPAIAALRSEDVEIYFSSDLSVEVNGDDLDAGFWEDYIDDLEEAAKDLVEELQNQMCKELDDEWDGMNTDEYISENIIANEYTFNEDGNRI